MATSPPVWMEISHKVQLDDERRRRAYDRSRELHTALARVTVAHEASLDSASTSLSLDNEEQTLEALIKDTVLSREFYNDIANSKDSEQLSNSLHARAPRLDRLSARLEDYARYKAFRYFLSHDGALLSPTSPCFIVSTNDDNHSPRRILTDEEYLAGACIGLCQDLATHAIRRAGQDAVTSLQVVQRARDRVSQILEELLQFDFRNGMLRKKYDGTKYALKTLETVLYELSYAQSWGKDTNSTETKLLDHSSKKIKVQEEKQQDDRIYDIPMPEQDLSDPEESIQEDEFPNMRARMEHRDALRERLIKTCRDGQKAAKQSIFALHRGDTNRASKLLRDCENCVVNHLMPILEEEPELRFGSYSALMEEYVEGMLFYTWIHGQERDTSGNTSTVPSGKILTPMDLPITVSLEEYLGGLCDLSGEIGRFAVARGTIRDRESVKLCLETNKALSNSLKIMGNLPGAIAKKIGMVNVSVEKLERMMYELSLMEISGWKEYRSAVEQDQSGEMGNSMNEFVEHV